MSARDRPAIAMILLAAGAAAYCADARSAADSSNWPRGPVRLVTPMAAGGGPDVVGRILAEGLAERWKQPVIVDNRPGADGVLAARALIDARDGHTILFSPSSVVAVNPLMHESLPYNPTTDVVPIAPVVDAVIGMVCAPSFNAASIGELVTLARSKPRALTYTTVFGAPHLLWLALQRHTRIEMSPVGYRNPNAAIPDVLEGRVHVALLPLGTILGQVRAGKLRLIAITSTKRSPVVPDVPTLAEAGYPDFVVDGSLALFGQPAFAHERREWIAREVRAVLAEPRVVGRLLELGYDVDTRSPDAYTLSLQKQRSMLERLSRLSKAKEP